MSQMHTKENDSYLETEHSTVYPTQPVTLHHEQANNAQSVVVDGKDLTQGGLKKYGKDFFQPPCLFHPLLQY